MTQETLSVRHGRGGSRDGLPEHQEWPDLGCRYHPTCLDCPLLVCRFDMKPGQARMALRQQRIRAALAAGIPLGRLPQALGIPQRTVYRLAAALREASA